MDTITHGITGALVGKAFFADRYGRSATLAVTLGAVFPDSDVFFALFAPNELATVEWHRGVTHSFLALPAFAALLAAMTRRLAARRARGQAPPLSFLTLWALYGLGLSIHILLDLITSFGTMIWSPLASTRAAWDLVFIIDLFFTASVLLPQVAAWIYGERARAWRRGALAWTFFTVVGAALAAWAGPIFEVPFPIRVVLVASGLLAAIFLLPAITAWGFRQPRWLFCRIGVGLLVGYLALCTTSHALALRQVEGFVRGRTNSGPLEVKTLAALPAPLSPFRWSGFILTSGGVYQCHFSLLDTHGLAFAFFPTAAPNRYIQIAEALPAVKTYRWFARFPVVHYAAQPWGRGEQHVVEYTDLRFAGGWRRRPAFTYRVVLSARGEVLRAGFLEP